MNVTSIFPRSNGQVSVETILRVGMPFKLLSEKPESRWTQADRRKLINLNKPIRELVVLSNGFGCHAHIEGSTFLVDNESSAWYELCQGERIFKKHNGSFHYRHMDKTGLHAEHLLSHSFSDLKRYISSLGYSGLD